MEVPSPHTLVMMTTVGSEEQGNLLARELIARRQAACVNLVPGVKSYYRWEGKICRDTEFLLVIKTMADDAEAVEATIGELHAYDLPEILAFDISRGGAAFLEWLRHSTDKALLADDDGDDEPSDPLF